MLIRIMGSLILMFKYKQKYDIAKELLNEKIPVYTHLHTYMIHRLLCTNTTRVYNYKSIKII